MSEFNVEVVRVGPIEKHPNADSLSITRVLGDYPVIIRTGDFNEGDLAVYVPIDSVVPDTERWAFLKGHRRIKAKKLRGVFSMGMLASLPDDLGLGGEGAGGWDVGDPCQPEMGIEKYEPHVHTRTIMSTEQEADQPFIPRYTDIEGLRRYGDIISQKEDVVITEKIHGSNGRWLFRDGRFWVGSHNYLRKEDPRNLWWQAMEKESLRNVCSLAENMLFFGEVYGNVQDLKYGLGDDIGVRMFDVFDTITMRYLDYPDFYELCERLKVDTVPLLYRGPWSDDLRSLAEGVTTLGGGHVREGFVVRPVRERWDDRIRRVILKFIGEGYLLRKGS